MRGSPTGAGPNAELAFSSFSAEYAACHSSRSFSGQYNWYRDRQAGSGNGHFFGPPRRNQLVIVDAGKPSHRGRT